jgi:hypothetical protein
MTGALSGAAWASIGAGMLVALLIAGAVVFTSRYGRRGEPAEETPSWQPTTRVEEEEPEEESPEEEPRPAPPTLDTTMIRWDRTLPPVPPSKPKEER